jgi:hypothetical protein
MTEPQPSFSISGHIVSSIALAASFSACTSSLAHSATLLAVPAKAITQPPAEDQEFLDE